MRKKIIIISSISALVILASIGTLKIVLFNNEEKNSEGDIQSQAIVSTDETSSLLDENNNFDSKKLGQVTINSSEASTESGKATEGRTTASERQTTTEHRTEGRTEGHTEGRTTESRTEARTETTTEGKRVEPTTETPNTEHTHNWVAVYKTIHHDATYKEEKYVVREAWDEDIVESYRICNQCGKSFRVLDWRLPGGGEDINSQAYIDFITHIADCQGIGSSYHTEERVVGSVHHDAEYGTRQVVDKPAWDEQVIDYYKCQCGATKK